MSNNPVPPEVETLIEELKHLPQGPLEHVPAKMTEYLAKTWHCFRGGEEAGMADWKVSRAENFHWKPPVLCFDIERHGGAAMGSTRAEIQTWWVNLETLTAECSITGKRQVWPMDKRLDTAKLAQEVVSQILRHECVEHLRWSSDKRRVRVLVGKLIPVTYQRTTQGRRRRFAGQLLSLLEQNGWRRVLNTLPHTYEAEPPASDKPSL